MKIVYGAKSCSFGTGILKSGDTLTATDQEVMDRWAEYFQELLNQPVEWDNRVMDCLPAQRPINYEL